MKRALVLASVLSLSIGAVVANAAADGTPSAAAADKEKHDHKEEEHKGEKKDLGTKDVGGYKVQVTQVGDVKAGEEAIFIIKPIGQGEPKAVRAWVGVESGQGSIKTKGEEEKEGEWHAHHQVSKPLPAKSKLWVELETAAGKTRTSFDWK
jgi:hypothetical protein